ncbi:MAG: holdfast anchoring protein HfaA [Rhizomicrobium sp.]
MSGRPKVAHCRTALKHASPTGARKGLRNAGTAVAHLGGEDISHRTTPMESHTKIRFAAAALVAGLAFAGSAQAGDFSNSASYNAPYGMQAGQENQAINPSLRDANGNLTAVNGQITSANFGVTSSISANGTVSAQGGVGTSGAGTAFGGATAIGNSLNVVTVGNNNTVVVNSTQINNGNQTATTTVNGH